jgi:hypothetical protein
MGNFFKTLKANAHETTEKKTENLFDESVLELKGAVSRDFSLLVFFINQFPPSPRVSH